MAFDWNNNPLKDVKVEMPDFCKDRNHTISLLLWGACIECRRMIPTPNDDTNVFDRLENIKKLGV